MLFIVLQQAQLAIEFHPERVLLPSNQFDVCNPNLKLLVIIADSSQETEVTVPGHCTAFNYVSVLNQ